MLKSLHIENYALIRLLDVDFVDGFTAITGETGAGKSILLGAIGLIAGNRADFGVLLNKEQKCIIEGHFYLEKESYEKFFSENDIDFDGDVIIRREISPSGKSRAFINDTPVQLTILKELGDNIINIHSQHETLLISESRFQMQILDAYSGNNALVNDYSNVYKQYLESKSNIVSLKNLIEKQSSDADYWMFLYKELEDASISVEEEMELRQEQDILTNAEKIGEGIFGSLQLLSESEDNVQIKLHKIIQLMQQTSQYLPALESLSDRMNQAMIEISDIADSLSKMKELSESNPERLEYVNNRLDEYNRLLHKHKVSEVAQLIAIKEEIALKQTDNVSLKDRLEAEEKKLEAFVGELEILSKELDKNRNLHATAFSESVVEILSQLGMPNASFKIAIDKLNDFGPDGINTAKFMFTANKGESLKELGSVISGGEMSRVMLAVKSMIMMQNMLPTIIFDEIDSGVSGVIAAKMGNILKNLSKNHQVIAITHLPQIASKAEEHIHVVKTDAGDKMETQLYKLEYESRVEVLAQMISDENISDSAIEMARELLSH